MNCPPAASTSDLKQINIRISSSDQPVALNLPRPDLLLGMFFHRKTPRLVYFLVFYKWFLLLVHVVY